MSWTSASPTWQTRCWSARPVTAGSWFSKRSSPHTTSWCTATRWAATYGGPGGRGSSVMSQKQNHKTLEAWQVHILKCFQVFRSKTVVVRSFLWIQEEAARNLIKLSSSDVTQGLCCIVGNAGKKAKRKRNGELKISWYLRLLYRFWLIWFKMHRKRARKKTKTGSGM